MSSLPFTIVQHKNWQVQSSSPVTILAKSGRPSTTLQMSLGPRVHIEERPIDAARMLVLKMGGQIRESEPGTCTAGDFGRVVFGTMTRNHCEIWIVGDGANFFSASYASDERPPAEELGEVAGMVKSVGWTKA